MVLFYLPNGAEEGAREIVQLVRPGGHLFVWLYGARRGDDKTNWRVKLRRTTTKIDHRTLYMMGLLPGTLIWLFFIIPNKIMRKLPFARGIVRKIAFQSVSNYGLFDCFKVVMQSIVIDAFATPIEYGYTKEEVFSVLRKCGLYNIKVSSLSTARDPEASWRAFGDKPKE